MVVHVKSNGLEEDVKNPTIAPCLVMFYLLTPANHRPRISVL